MKLPMIVVKWIFDKNFFPKQLLNRLFIWILLFFSPFLAVGQFHNGSTMSFGKNRVQWDNTIWLHYRFDQFDTYFYLNGEELAQYTARYADQELAVLERRLQTALNEKIQFIVFNSLGDLKQSNIGLSSQQQYNTGGITHILGTKVFIYFDGNYAHFEQQIRAGIADILVKQLMFGGSITSQMRNAITLQLPAWYEQGLLSYISLDWDTQLDSRLQEGVLSNKFKKMNQLEGEEAIIAGHSFWRYIEQRFGPTSIPDIIHITKQGQNIKSGFYYVTGVKFKQLVKDWFAHYKTYYSAIDQDLPAASLPLKYRTYRSFNRPEYSPDERYLSYSTNDEGLLKFWLYDLHSGKKKRLFKTGYRTDEKIDKSYPITAWHPSGDILAFIVEEKGDIVLRLYNISEKRIDERNMFDFQKINHISYAGDGRRLVMSAVRKGKPDIYIFDLASNSHTQITDDYYTDLNPLFTDHDRKIVFSSNRPHDTLVPQKEILFQDKGFNLFSYDYVKKDTILQRLTDNELSNDLAARMIDRNKILYLSDESGWVNLYGGRLDSTIAFVDTAVHYRYFMESEQLSGFTTNILDYGSSPLADNYFISARQNQREKLFKLRADDLYGKDFTSEVRSDFMREQESLLDERAAAEEHVHIGRKSFRSLFRPAILADSLETDPPPTRQGAFGISGKRRLSLLNQGKEGGLHEKGQTPKKRNYLVEYYYDELVTQIDFAYINQSYQPFTGGGSPIFLNPGFNIFMGVNFMDLLEDYRISAGVKLATNLVNNEYVISFSNLKNRLDKTITFHRQAVENFEDTAYTRTFSHQLFYMLSWPFKETLSLRGTAIYRNDMISYQAYDFVSLKQRNRYQNWIGLRTELVYDNTRDVAKNILYGSRWKLFGEYYQLVDRSFQNFIVLGLDYRHYTRIHKNFIWANRFAASTSFGNNLLIYYMGGVDNWLIPKFNQDIPIDYTKNYAYQTLATNMRGFHQNIRNGTSFAVLNSELRFPVFSYFFSNPISSAFIRNFQILAFGDIGTAWTGINPYDPSNSLYTSYIYSGPLSISVQQQKEPIVGGLGFGVRSTILGYFVRADLAWGIEDMHFTKPVLYISFSLDF